MGNGASMEDGGPSQTGPAPSSARPSSVAGASSSGLPSGRIVSSAQGSVAGGRRLSRTSSQMSGAWKSALKNASLSQSGLRKMRAAALGRKSACTVQINKTGFSLQHIQICEGQVITFEWHEPESQGFNVTQVTHDGDKYRPVVGGFNSGAVSKRGFFEQQFNLAGEYKFVSSGLRCTPLTVEVYERKDVEAELSDNGFSPKLIRVDEGNFVRWNWSSCSVPHTVQEMKFSHKTGTLVSKHVDDRPIPTKAGSFRKEFNKPGMFYFTTEGISTGIMHTCIVHVRERQREFKIDLEDRAFSPPIIVIEEGDRVWFSWDKAKLQKPHCVYQIEPPPLDHPSDESYKPFKNGFKWPSPTRSGLLSAEFFDPGVYYFSDHNFQEAAEYTGTIIVKPKQVEHFVELTSEGFNPDLIYAHTGERVWWTWMTGDVDTNFNIMEIEKCISPVGGRPNIENEASGEGSYMDEELEQLKVNAGLETVQLGSIGVYHYRVSDSPNNISTCSIITNGGPRNHTVHVTDAGFEPKVVTIHPGDRIWWVWQNAKKQHNIVQVSHQGNHIKGGFQSGALMDCPSAFMWQFKTPGVFYYISETVAKVFGAIVVTSQPRVHEVQVAANSIVPDPLPININDVVAWTFRGLRQNDVHQVETVDQVLEAQFNSQVVSPRRSMNRLFTERGVCHFASRSFLKQGKKDARGDETRISSVLVDEMSDSAVVRVDSKGFHADYITIKKGQSVLWTWKESGEEAHNIIHVNNTSSETPLSVIQGGKSFNSGRPVPKNSFLYTFDEPGTYCVASQGAPGYAGTIHVLSEATATGTPFISSDRDGGTMDKFSIVKLKCDTKNAQIFYTLDGSAPELHKLHTKSSVYGDIYYVKKHLTGGCELYDPKKGVVLKNSGLCFVRAMAISRNHLNSEIFTSQRFWVLSGEESAESASEPEQESNDNPAMALWWQCIPTIKAVFTNPGVMEVFWDPPPQEAKQHISGYNLFLNEVTYSEIFPPVHSAVNVSGLAGGRTYEVYLQVNPVDGMFLPHKSNKLIMKCPKTNSTGGPIVSLETTENPDAMAIVWMSISTDQSPIEAYRVYLNGQMCGNPVVPDPGSDRCKVVIEGCKTDFDYRVVVAAVGQGSNQKMSNELMVSLPLDTRFITLPPNELRSDDDDLYKEYIEVTEGTDDHVTGAANNEADMMMTGDIPTLDFTVPVEQQRLMYDGEGPMYEEEEQEEGYANEEAGYEMYESPPPHMNHERTLGGLEGIPGPEMDKMGTIHEENAESDEDTNDEETDEEDTETDGDDDKDEKRERTEKTDGDGKQSAQNSNDEDEEEEDTESDTDTSETCPNKPTRAPENQQDVKNNPVSRTSTTNGESNSIPPDTERISLPEDFPSESARSHENVAEPLPQPGEGVSNHKQNSPLSNSHYPHPPLREQYSVGSSGGHVEELADDSGEGYQSEEEPVADTAHLNMQNISGDSHSPIKSRPESEHQVSRPVSEARPPSYPKHQAQHSERMQQAPPIPLSAKSHVNQKPISSAHSSHVTPQDVHSSEQRMHQQAPPLSSQQPVNHQQAPPTHPMPSPTSGNHHPPPQYMTPPSAHHAPPIQAPFPQQAPPIRPQRRGGFGWGTPSQAITVRNMLTPRQTTNVQIPMTQYPKQQEALQLQSIDVTRPPSFRPPAPPSSPFVDMSRPPLPQQFQNHTPNSASPSPYPVSSVPLPSPFTTSSAHHSASPSPFPVSSAYPDMPGGGDSGFIDATMGPWMNKMKTASESIRFMRRMNTVPEDVMKRMMLEQGMAVTEDGHYQVEVEEEEEQEEGIPEGEGLEQMLAKRKKKSKTAVVEVQETGHLHMEDPKTEVVTAAVPTLGVKEDQDLPAPMVTAETLGDDEIMVRWNFRRSAEPLYKLLVNIVNVVGSRFKQKVTSDISFECLQEEDSGAAVPAVQHIWNVTSGNQCLVKGLAPGTSYTIYVVANYALAANAQQPYEIQAKSQPIKYTTLGPPPPPQLRVVSTDLYQVTLGWDVPEHHKEVNITGFKAMVNGTQLGGTLAKNVRQTVIDNLQPGKTINVQIVTVTDGKVKDSDLSNVVKVTCPSVPTNVSLNQQPSYKKGTVTLAWDKPTGSEHAPFGEEIIYYRIYLDGTWHGEVKACAHCNKNGYQYYLTDLKPGQAYDVTVKAFCGQKKVDPSADQVYVLCDSTMSNSVPVMAPAPPTSPHLRLEGMHNTGIDVTWEMPQQYGDAALSGYQMLKNGKLYGSIIPGDVHQLAIHGLSLGEKVELQILALTDHPVGRQEAGGPPDGDSGVGTGTITSSHDDKEYSEIYLGDRYSACKPGPKLTVLYTGLVQPPSKVWCEQVTGHSAMVVWAKDQRPKPHYVFPETFQVTWWEGEKPDREVNSQSTKDDHLLITGLHPNRTYNVVVEARKMQKYREIQDSAVGGPCDDSKSTKVQGEVISDTLHNTFILTAQSDRLSLRTASPPTPPSNLGVVATTCTSIQVAWDPPREQGVEIIAMRVDAVTMKGRERNNHSFVEVTADARSAVVENLLEKTEYLLTVTAVTEEYFEQLPPGHDQKRAKRLPTSSPPQEDPWLPSSSVMASTSGTDAPSDLKIIKTSVDSVTVSWTPAVVYGSNRLQGTIVRWAEGKFSKQTNRDETMLAHHKSIEADSNKITLHDLNPGILYKIVVEAVVSVKMTLQADSNRDPELEKNNRRTTHVMSKPIFTRTRAPCEPPKPIVTGYTTDTISLYWEKPKLYSVIGKNDNGTPKYLKLSLEGYRIEINGKPHMRLASNAQSCTLIKCKPGKTYKVVLVALTCTEDVKKERRKRNRNPLANSTLSESSSSTLTNKEWEVTAEDLENDDSPSLPVEVTLPRLHDGLLSDVSCRYIMPSGGLNENQDLGDIQVDWTVQGDDKLIRQFSIVWHCLEDGSLQKKAVDPDVRTSVIPVQHQKCLYNITVEPQYSKEVVIGNPEKVQCLVPGSPDAPEIWLRGVSITDFVIEWGEPRLYGIKIRGYQVYLNGKKVGNTLNTHHRKAVIPCKPRRQYKVNLHALSADENFSDSVPSNTLLVHSGQMEPTTATIAEENEDMVDGGDPDELNVKIVKLTDSTIQLDWSLYTEPQGMSYYRVAWSSTAQPSEREVKLPSGEKSCIIHKCYPGVNHYIRIYAMSADDQILERSRQITAQTCATPDTPNVTLRACNFKYVAIQWNKPNSYGDALITGYKVFVNGVVEAALGPEQFSYSYTHGKWCREYIFQVQAVTGTEKLCSKPSEPLVVTWPGVQPPVLRKAPSVTGNSVKIVWDPPQSTEGVKVKQYKLICMEEETERPIQIISPIHPDTCEAELHNLKHGTYLVYVETHLHASSEIVKSDILKIRPTITPDSPQINVTVIGLEERRQIEKVTCDLINKRDRLLNVLSAKDLNASPRHTMNEDDVSRNKAAESLAQVEEMMDDCLASLNHYTGHLLAHVSWTAGQSNPDVRVSGYKVLVDGKQYGTTLHAGVKHVRIKLGLGQPSHRLSMVSVCDRPHTTSVESNVVELLTEPFLPFTFFSFLSQAPKGKKLAGPAFHEALALERKQSGSRKPVNQGLLKRKVPPPSCTLMDIFQGDYHAMFPPSGPSRPTAILFWSKWCFSSQRTLGWFVKFARNHSSQYEFLAVACTPGKQATSPAERQELVSVISENGWREDSCIRHVTSQSANAITLMSDPNTTCRWHKHGDHMHDETFNSTDCCEIFGIQGVPTILIVHPEDYIAWKGRYCANDYASFGNFMMYVFAQSMKQNPPGPDPWDTSISSEALEGTTKRRVSDSQMMIHRPTGGTTSTVTTTTVARKGSATTTINLNGSVRPPSGKNSSKLFTKTNKHKKEHQSENQRISVNARPFSASSASQGSPYSQSLNPSPQRRVKSGRKSTKNTTF